MREKYCKKYNGERMRYKRMVRMNEKKNLEKRMRKKNKEKENLNKNEKK